MKPPLIFGKPARLHPNLGSIFVVWRLDLAAELAVEVSRPVARFGKRRPRWMWRLVVGRWPIVVTKLMVGDIGEPAGRAVDFTAISVDPTKFMDAPAATQASCIRYGPAETLREGVALAEKAAREFLAEMQKVRLP